MLFKILIIISIVFVPSIAFAWGPLTHIYLGSELYSLGPLLPAGIYAILRKYKNDFLYGNLMADIIIGKKYLPDEKSSHSWNVALNLLDSARTQQQKAFVYGYMSHLAADTVVHEGLKDMRNISHVFFEIKADNIIDKRYWFKAIAMEKKVQIRNDIFLENSLERVLFSFKTNKRIFKVIVLLSGLNQQRIGTFIDRKNVLPFLPDKKKIENFHERSLERMIDLLRNGNSSKVLKYDPKSS